MANANQDSSNNNNIEFTVCILEDGDREVIVEEGEWFTIEIKKLFDTSVIKLLGFDLDHIIGFNLDHNDDFYTRVRLRLGYFNSVVNEVIHKSVYKTKLNELSRITFEINPDILDESFSKKTYHHPDTDKVYLDLGFEIKLIKVEKPRPASEIAIYNLNENELYLLCLEHKNDGNELFKKNMIRTAFKRYHKSISYLIVAHQIIIEKKNKRDNNLDESLETSNIDNLEESIESIEKKILTTKSQLYSNLAMCQLKNNTFDLAIINCTKCLDIDPMNVKAIFRRAQARAGSNDYDEAINDFKLALKLDPENKEIKQKLAHVENLKKTYNLAISNKLKKLFL